MPRIPQTDLDVFTLCLGGNVFGWTADEPQSFGVLDRYLAAGLIIGRAPDGTLTHFGAVGWLSVACTLTCLWLVGRIRVVDSGTVMPSPP